MVGVLMALVSGVMVGTLSGLVGIGGGVLLVPILLYLFKLDAHLAAGTSLAIVIPTAVVGSIVHFSRGNVDWHLTALIAVGSIAGSMLGAWLGNYISAEALKKIFAVILVLITIKFTADAFQWRFPVRQVKANEVAATVTSDHVD